MWPISLPFLRHPSGCVPQFLPHLDQLISETAATPQVLSEDLSSRLFFARLFPECLERVTQEGPLLHSR